MPLQPEPSASVFPMPGVPTLPDSCRQLIYCVTEDWDAIDAELNLWERENAFTEWKQIGETIPAVVGKSGLTWGSTPPLSSSFTLTKKEGDNRAPAGLWALGLAYGYGKEAPNPDWPYLHVTEDYVAVDDSASVYYNQILEQSRVDSPDWISAENMRRHDVLYRYGLVIEYNTQNPIPGKGSCIFMHIWRGEGRGTEGCTAMSEENLLKVLRWLDKEKNPLLWTGVRGDR